MDEIFFSAKDLFLTPLYVLLVFYVGKGIQNRNIKDNPIYRFYTRGLMLKMGGAIAVCLIYVFYYGGGDTTGYFKSSTLVARMLGHSPNIFFSVLGGNLSMDNLYEFVKADLCCPDYYRDSKSFAVVRVATPITLLTFFSYFSTSCIFAALSYGGIWRLFMLFNELYPGQEKRFAIAILYMPSLVFWGSGILKDTITFSAACWFTYCVYLIFIKRDRRLRNILTMLVSVLALISVKPYIFVALLPGTAIWISFNRIKNIRNTAVRLMAAPFIIVAGMFLSSSILGALGSELGEFGSVDQALNKAVVTKNDLTRDAYGPNSFDIGELDGTTTGALSKFPVAVVAGLYRPFLWEARSLVIFISGLENTFLLIMTLMTLAKVGPGGVLFRISREPLLIFSFIFAIFFAFSVGLTTANFGALVRYKIPCIPFFLSTLFILQSKTQQISPEEQEALKVQPKKTTPLITSEPHPA